MNVLTSRVRRLDRSAHTAGSTANLQARAVWTGAAGVGFAVAAFLMGAAQGQEYVVGDLPQGQPTVMVSDGAVVGLPLDAAALDPSETIALPMPSILADESVDVQGEEPFGTDVVVDEEADAAEYEISDGWTPGLNVGPVERCPRFTTQTDALLLFMGSIPNRTVFVDDATGRPALGVNDANPAMSAAPRYAITWHRDACRAFEVNYFSVGAFKGTARASAPPGGALSSEGTGGVPFNDVVEAGLQTTSGIKSLEFNLRRTQGGIFTWIGGFRWVQWNQQLLIGDLFVDTTGTPGFDAYSTSTGNNLYGGQIGGDIMLWNRGDRLRVNGLAKGGVYYNHQAYQHSRILSDSALLDSAASATKDTVSFVGEVGLVGEYRLTNWLSWRAGYTVFWLGGVANAANQLALTDFGNDPPTTSISPYSSVLLHGATTGIEARW